MTDQKESSVVVDVIKMQTDMFGALTWEDNLRVRDDILVVLPLLVNPEGKETFDSFFVTNLRQKCALMLLLGIGLLSLGSGFFLSMYDKVQIISLLWLSLVSVGLWLIVVFSQKVHIVNELNNILDSN